MGKVKSPAPDHLTMRLFDPGMSLLHRAGLGGLACTLKAMEGEFPDGGFPWEVEPQSVTLKFGRPENAAECLKRLFAFAFAIRPDGLIRLPGQHAAEPAAAVLADMQAGLTLTFLQHGKVRGLAKEPSVVSYDPEGEGTPGVVVQYRKCSGFKHRDGWEEFVEKDGTLTRGTIRVDGPISPGTVVRHVAFTGDTAAEDPPERMLPLHFALVGCLALPVNRGVAALLVPEVEDLTEFVFDRPAMSPTTARECQIANAADAVLQALIRIRSRRVARGLRVPGCYAMTFTPTPWASQQKSRVATIHVPPGKDSALDRFDRAWHHLPNRVVGRTARETSGKGRTRAVTERRESFRSDNAVRPLIAENLALGRPWYAGFVTLMTKVNPATDRPYRDQFNYPEVRKGLNAMIADEKMWDHDGEKVVVRAVHEAMRMRYGQIAEENRANPAGMRNRMERFREKLRLDLAGAKAEAHVRFALMDLFSRGGNNGVLRGGWETVLPVIRKDWQLARDLGLLALASYAGRGEAETPDQPEPTN